MDEAAIKKLITDNVRIRVTESNDDYYNRRSRTLKFSLHWGDEDKAFASDSVTVMDGEPPDSPW